MFHSLFGHLPLLDLQYLSVSFLYSQCFDECVSLIPLPPPLLPSFPPSPLLLLSSPSLWMGSTAAAYSYRRLTISNLHQRAINRRDSQISALRSEIAELRRASIASTKRFSVASTHTSLHPYGSSLHPIRDPFYLARLDPSFDPNLPPSCPPSEPPSAPLSRHNTAPRKESYILGNPLSHSFRSIIPSLSSSFFSLSSSHFNSWSLSLVSLLVNHLHFSSSIQSV